MEASVKAFDEETGLVGIHRQISQKEESDMDANAGQKDRTLRKIIDMCGEKYGHLPSNPLMIWMMKYRFGGGRDDFCVPSEERRIIFLRGKLQAFAECAAECDKMLGYSGSMPSEVPNQSEDAK